jgi:hypothetical protein
LIGIILTKITINHVILKYKIMEEKKPEVTSKITAEKTAVVATPKPRKPRVSKTTNEVDTTIVIPVAEENQQEPFIEELDSQIELEQKKEKKDKKKKKNKMKEKEKEKAKKAKAKEKAKAKAKKAKKAKKEKAKKAKAKEKKAKAKAKKAKKNKKNKSKKK